MRREVVTRFLQEGQRLLRAESHVAVQKTFSGHGHRAGGRELHSMPHGLSGVASRSRDESESPENCQADQVWRTCLQRHEPFLASRVDLVAHSATERSSILFHTPTLCFAEYSEQDPYPSSSARLQSASPCQMLHASQSIDPPSYQGHSENGRLGSTTLHALHSRTLNPLLASSRSAPIATRPFSSSSASASSAASAAADAIVTAGSGTADVAGMVPGSGSEMATAAAADVLVDGMANGVAIAGSEVAAAAMHAMLPVACLQYLIDAVHVHTGLPWWLSIAATTLAMRVALFPLMVYQIRAATKLAAIRPELERMTERVKAANYDPARVEWYRDEMKKLMTKHKTSPFAPLAGLFIQAPLFIGFYFAIQGLAEHVPSFATGGAFWFSDLTTPDHLYLLPVLSSLTILASVELNAAEGMESAPNAAQMKLFMRGLGILMIPMTLSFPKAVFCYWVTTNIISLVQGLVLKQPAVRRALDIPTTAQLASMTSNSQVNLGSYARSNQSEPSRGTVASALPPRRADKVVLSSPRKKSKR